MPGRGPLPKPDEQRQRTNPVPETTELALDASFKAPSLPGSSRFLAATRRWYRVWCGSVQAPQFIDTDWLRLHMLAQLVDAFYRTDNPAIAKQLLGEIRLNEQKLGATPEDRLRLRWQFRKAEQEEATAAKATRRPSRSRVDPRLKVLEGGGAS